MQEKQQIILASGSPRRIEMFENLGLNFKSVVSDVEEITDETNPCDIVMSLAEKKAKHVFKSTKGLVVAADTIVWFDKKALNKPKDKTDAKEMLKKLSGNVHEVYTGICIINNEKTITDYCKTKVYFKNITEDEIDRYIKTEEPMDKAGSYNIGGLSAVFIEKIEGDFFNVVGFPISLFSSLMSREFGYNII